MSAPKLQFTETTETCIKVQFTLSDPSAAYKLQWKEHPQPWDSANSKVLKAGATTAEAEDLQPGTTYCIRLASMDGSQQPGPELVLDTEQVGCTPTAKKGRCVIS